MQAVLLCLEHLNKLGKKKEIERRKKNRKFIYNLRKVFNFKFMIFIVMAQVQWEVKQTTFIVK